MHIKIIYIEILMRYNLGNNILYKRIVSSNSVTLITIRKTTMSVFLDLKINRGLKVACS